MSLPVDLAAATREELIEVVGQLLSYTAQIHWYARSTHR